MLDLPDAEATRRAGAALGRVLAAPDTPLPLRIALAGELGAGKTTFVGGLMAALGHAGPVRSPTYTLIEPYVLAGLELQHCDLYRVEGAEAVDELGLRDLTTPRSVVLVEWPQRAAGRLDPWDLTVQLDYLGEGRRCAVQAGTPAGIEVLRALELELA